MLGLYISIPSLKSFGLWLVFPDFSNHFLGLSLLYCRKFMHLFLAIGELKLL